ncbi:hypothetical protein M433DRAFT_154520 [Acidomyces richmondensis BFW]|nr:MAG: hypothetical protein FE78DRAFT_90616 [Acidomyces sp. 'richmondensis']KYG45449.1 hypothetical protein M433DRAFT_154520 [Acidomyces richmondensis BFW]
MAYACATCASVYNHLPKVNSEKSVLLGRYLPCCTRSICADCLIRNKRYASYCPYCQITTEPSVLPQGLKDPPAYSSFNGHNPCKVELDNGLDEKPPAYAMGEAAQSFHEKKQDEEPALDVLHFVTPNDSMHGLSLAYGVPIDVLRKTNNIFSDHLLQGRQTILIPGEFCKGGVSLSPRPVEGEAEEAMKNKIRRWMMSCKVAEYDVAVFYLKQAEWELEAAINAFHDDEQWEKEHPMAINEVISKGKSATRVGMRRYAGTGGSCRVR